MTARPAPHGLETSLLRVEQLLVEVSAALIAGEPWIERSGSRAGLGFY